MKTNEIKVVTAISDQDAIQRILNGDNACYEVLMRRSNQLLYRVIRGYIKEDNITKDIMQEAYIKAYLKLREFKGASSFSTWLVRIGINEALTYIKKSQKVINVWAGVDKEFDPYFQDKMHPEMKMIQSESGSHIENAIDELPPKLRTVFIMIEIEGLNINCVSTLLDLSKTNVKVRLHRAKKLLRSKLAQFSDLEHLYAYGAEYCDALVNRVMKIILEMDRQS